MCPGMRRKEARKGEERLAGGRVTLASVARFGYLLDLVDYKFVKEKCVNSYCVRSNLGFLVAIFELGLIYF